MQYPLYCIRVEVWSIEEEDGFEEWCGEFLWGLDFSAGATLIFDTVRVALEYLDDNKREAGIKSIQYRYRIQPVDNSDGAFGNETA